MPLSDPDAYRDKTADWLEFFHRERRRVVQELLTPELVELQRTSTQPETVKDMPHLHLVMNYLRLAPVIGKSFVYAEEPYRRYRIGRITQRGVPGEILDESAGVFDNERDARHAVFRMRLESIGIDLPPDGAQV
jgi:hypothetical protein